MRQSIQSRVDILTSQVCATSSMQSIKNMLNGYCYPPLLVYFHKLDNLNSPVISQNFGVLYFSPGSLFLLLPSIHQPSNVDFTLFFLPSFIVLIYLSSLLMISNCKVSLEREKKDKELKEFYNLEEISRPAIMWFFMPLCT